MARNLGVPYTEKQPYYFISYNSEDEKRVSEYADKLAMHNVPLWYDKGIKVGSAWENEIVERMESCEAVIMFLSKNIFMKENSYVHKEFELATKHFNKKIYIMMLDDVKDFDVPNRFKMWWINVTGLQCINTYEYDSIDAGVQMLLEGIGAQSLSVNEKREDRVIKSDDEEKFGILKTLKEIGEGKKELSFKVFMKLFGAVTGIGFIIVTLLISIYTAFNGTDWNTLDYHLFLFLFAFPGTFLWRWSWKTYKGFKEYVVLISVSALGAAGICLSGLLLLELSKAITDLIQVFG